MEKAQLCKNNIPNRVFILSPTVKSGQDRECSKKDFAQLKTSIDLGRLGEGVKVQHLDTKSHYIIRVIQKDVIVKKGFEKKINGLLEYMYKTTHPYILRLLNHFEDEVNLYFIFEGSEFTSLQEKLLSKPTEETLLNYFIQILIAAQHLQSFGSVNICLLPERIVIDEEDFVKLTDFGWNMVNSSKDKRQTYSIGKGNNITAYTTPEEIDSIKNGTKFTHSKKSDSWNLGVLLYEMFSYGQSPFKGNTMDEFATNILDCNIDYSIITNEEIKQLISQLLVKDPLNRISIEDVIQYEYFKSVSIEIPQLEISDCIINQPLPNDDNHNGNSNNNNNPLLNMNTTNYDYDSLMSSIRDENEQLKKEIENYRQIDQMASLPMGSHTSISMDNSKPSITYTDNNSNSNPNNTERTSEEAQNDDNNNNNNDQEDKTPLTDIDILNKEKFLDDKIGSMAADQEVDEDIKLNSHIRLLDNDLELLDSNFNEEKEKNKRLENRITQLEKDKINLEEKIKLNAFDKIEEAISSSSDPKKTRDAVITSSLKRFDESLGLFKEIVQKFIDMTQEEHVVLLLESKSFIDDKGKIFFEIINKMKEGNNNSSSMDNKDFDSYGYGSSSNMSAAGNKDDQKKLDWAKTVIDNLQQFKKKLQVYNNKEQQLIEQYNSIEEKFKVSEELNVNLIKKSEENEMVYKQLSSEKENSENTLSEIKAYMQQNLSSISTDLLEDFFLKF